MLRRDEREILIATLLGDGCLVRHAKQGTCWLQLKHSPAQRAYLLWKVARIEQLRLIKGRTFTVKDSVNQHSNGKTYPVCVASMYGLPYFRVLRKWLYRDRQKTFTRVLQYLQAPETLAVWFMDDGSVNRRRRKHRDGTEYFLRPTLRLALCSGVEECEAVLTWFRERFDVTGYPVRHSRRDAPTSYFILNFDAENTQRIWELIAPTVAQVPGMLAKFDLCATWYPESLSRVARVPGDSAATAA